MFYQANFLFLLLEKLRELFGWHECTLPYLCVNATDRADVAIGQIFKGSFWFYPVLGLSSFWIIHVAASNATVPTRWGIHWVECGLSNLCLPTYGTSVGFGQIFKGGSRRDPVLRFTPGRIVNVTTGFTNIRLHLFHTISLDFLLLGATFF
jgi:hypothetical protein